MMIWHWLWHGSDALQVPQSWLDNAAQMRVYEEYTERQLHQGRVVKDTAATARDRFWVAQDAKREPRSLRFPRAVER